MLTVTIHYANGSQSQFEFASFMDARHFYRNGISYSDRVKRVTATERGHSPRPIWDASWDDLSKYEGLNA